GDYTYLIPGVAPCPSVSAVITVNVVTDAFAGGDGSLSLCTSGNITSLFSRLQGTPDTGGDWLAPNGTPFSGSFNPLSDPGGAYTYVIAVPQPCVNDTAEVLVNVTPAVTAGNDTSLTLCSTSATINLFDHLGTADEGGSWTGPEGPSSSAYYPFSGIAGDFTYTVLGTAPCPNVSATVSITLNIMPDAGLDGTAFVCPEAAPVNLFATLGGTPDLGGSWTAPNGLPHGNIFDPATDPQGVYTYTVNGAAPCPNDNATATVHIYLVSVPNAGPDAVSCTYDHYLSATGIWISSAWSGPSGSTITNTDSASTTVSVSAGGAYVFIWRTRSAEGCTSSDTVTIVFTDPIIPTVNVTDALCNGSCDGAANATATGGNVIAAGYQHQWSAPGGATPWSIGYCAGNYTVTVLDTNGCWATTNFTIQEPVPLEIDLITATDELCLGSCDGTILVTDPEGAHYSLNNGSSLQEEELFTGLCAGAYTVTMLDDNGCTASSMAFIGSPAPVRAGFSVHPDSLFINDPVAAFTNTSSANATHFLWDFGDGTTSAEISPTHSFPMGMAADYEICLTAMTDNGCPDIYCVPLPVLELPGIFVPNAFTPDGDGRNDVFHVSGTGLSPNGFHLMIFDRWGEKVFDTTDLHGSWDGTHKGVLVKTEVYVWKLIAYPLYSIVPYEMMGHVTVVR
ncbi:MAG: gliding motility-associated C-terminal domain-containing protein, partial [Flavobacteriales bacterium]